MDPSSFPQEMNRANTLAMIELQAILPYF